jgi:hypothetical protein
VDKAEGYCQDQLARWQDSLDREALGEQEADGDD